MRWQNYEQEKATSHSFDAFLRITVNGSVNTIRSNYSSTVALFFRLYILVYY